MVVESIVETFGAFLIPAALFVVGAIGYGLLLLLTRYDLLPSREPPE